MKCSLCGISEENGDHIFYEDENFIICRTKNLKGHRERAMIVYKRHVKNIGSYYYVGMGILKGMLNEIFTYPKKVVIMDGLYASIPDHWHYVVSDLDPDSDDFEQVIGTPWVEVIHLEDWQ